MKLNIDCVRDILLLVEQKEFRVRFSLDELCRQLNYSKNDIEYCCIKLSESNMLEVLMIPPIREDYQPIVCSVGELTSKGHDFLENIRPQTRLEIIKTHAKSLSNYSLNILNIIGQNIMSHAVSTYFNNLQN